MERIKTNFIFPSLETERGEISRVAVTFARGGEEKFVEDFLTKFNQAQLTALREEVWSSLDNTDSSDIKVGEWETLKYHADAGSRDWETLKRKMESGESVDAPIIVKIDNKFHLVSGNTRLMVAKALGIVPHVVIVEMVSS